MSAFTNLKAGGYRPKRMNYLIIEKGQPLSFF